MKRLRFPGTLLFSLTMMVIGFGVGVVAYSFYAMDSTEKIADSPVYLWILGCTAFASIGVVILLIWLALTFFAVSKVGERAVDRIETQRITLGKRKSKRSQEL
jgi:hypothetical protein